MLKVASTGFRKVKLFRFLGSNKLKAAALKLTKKELLNIDERMLLGLLTRVLISESPNNEIKEFFEVRRQVRFRSVS